MNHRSLRLAAVIEKELGNVLSRELEFPGALVTITNVDLGKNLDRAVISFSIFPSSKAEEIIDSLNKNKRKLRQILMPQIKMKIMPNLEFQIDKGYEDAAAVEKILIDDKNN